MTRKAKPRKKPGRPAKLKPKPKKPHPLLFKAWVCFCSRTGIPIVARPGEYRDPFVRRILEQEGWVRFVKNGEYIYLSPAAQADWLGT